MMKRMFWVILSSILITSCSDPKDILLTQASDIEKNSEKISKLSDEDKKLLIGYVFRAEAGSIFGQQSHNAYGITVGEAIEDQKKFIDDQKKKEVEQKAKQEEAQKELERQQEKLNSAVDVIFVNHEPSKDGFADTVRINIKFINKSGKTIIGTKGVAIFSDKFGDVLKKINLKNDFNDIGGKLETGKDYNLLGSINVNPFINEDGKFADTPTSDIKFTYKPEIVLFEDGTKLEIHR